MSNGNTPAFPIIEESKSEGCDGATYMTGTAVSFGLTKREMFAMAALQGILAKPEVSMNYAAEDAVKFADELIAELEKPE